MSIKKYLAGCIKKLEKALSFFSKKHLDIVVGASSQSGKKMIEKLLTTEGQKHEQSRQIIAIVAGGSQKIELKTSFPGIAVIAFENEQTLLKALAKERSKKRVYVIENLNEWHHQIPIDLVNEYLRNAEWFCVKSKKLPNSNLNTVAMIEN